MNYELKMLILKKCGSQAELARKCGRNDNWISRIVTGVRLPTTTERADICKHLGLKSIDKFLAEAGDGAK